MTQSSPVFCETAELAVEATALAGTLGLAITPELSADPLDAAAHAVARGGSAIALCASVPDPARLIEALDACSGAINVVIGAIHHRDEHAPGIAADVGFVCVRDVAPALAALALLNARAERPWRASARKLTAADRLRLEPALGAAERGAGRLLSLGAEGIAWQLNDDADPVKLGHGLAAAQALLALARRDPRGDAAVEVTLPADLTATREVLFGPPRLLSDPASKAALQPFGLPLPQEELCTSPSRAASEAARIGFPVRISLASPDLRVWDHPDLSVDGVDNAARVRDVYRQLVAVAEERAPSARVLGVSVTATTLARALIRATARPLPNGRVLLRIGFSDPHGATAKDATSTVLPASARTLERALSRLSAAALLFGEGNAERERNLQLVSELFTRLARFVDTFRREVERVELHPLALLVGEGAEIREAAIQVTDAFVRELG